MRHHILFLLMLCAFCTVGATPGATQQSKTLAVRPNTGELAGQTAYTNSYAILIGVNDYAFLPKDVHLHFAAKDATDLRDVLVRSYGFPAENVTVLLNEQATRANIEAALSALADDKVKPGDRVLIYFSGHGQTVKLQDGGEMGFLIPYDAKVDLAHPENRSGYLATCLRMDSIWGYLEASAAKHRLLVADSCFGGLLVKGKALNGEKPNRAVIAGLLARPALQVMTAGASNEEAQEDPKLGHSTYTFKLLEQLKSQAATPDNVFLASELAAILKTSVGNLTDSKQTPQFGNYHGTEGDFVFVSTEPHSVSPLQPVADAVQHPVRSQATVLLDGNDLSAWTISRVRSDRSQKLVWGGWNINNGVLEVVPGAGDLLTKEQYGDIQLHVEFNLAYMPNERGEARSNSGVILDRQYEIQILDSVDNPTQFARGCGAIYGLREPDRNVCMRPGEWQTYDITFWAPRLDQYGRVLEKPRVTLVWNGVKVHDNVVIDRPTLNVVLDRPNYPARPAAQEYATGPILLQEHGAAVKFRNIRVTRIK